MLRDATGFSRGHFGGTNVIQQRRFTVIDVAHHRHHRGAGQGFGLLLQHFVVSERLWIVQCSHDRGVTHFFHQNHGGVLVKRLVDGDHLTQLHQVFDHFRGFDRHLVCQFSHRDGFGHVNFNHACFDRSGLHTGVFTVTVIAATAATAGWRTPVGAASWCWCGRTTGRNSALLFRVAGPAA